MSPKMKRCINRLRSRQNTPKVLHGEDPSGTGATPPMDRELMPRASVSIHEVEPSGKELVSPIAVDTGESVVSGKLSVPPVQASTYESKGTDPGEYDGLDESTMIVKREEAKKAKRMEKAPLKKQKIECEASYWGPTKQIEEARLIALLKREVETEYRSGFKLVTQLSGAFNVAYVLSSSQGPKVCVRVPACGFPARWNSKDAGLLRATALGMKYIRKNSKLPIPKILGYSDNMNNEISTPYTIMSFLEGESVTILWDDKSAGPSVLEARRQTIMHSLANIMCSLSTTNFARAGTLWFPMDEVTPVVGDSYRLDKDDIFALNHDFITYPQRDSVEDLLRGGREKRFKLDDFPRTYRGSRVTGVYLLWSLMIEAFLQSGAKLAAGEPEFVLMQSDFNPQNILADECGNVTGIIDWDCLESIPRQIGWCSLPHWIEKDWYPDYQWPPDIGIEHAIKPDQYDRYRQDYTDYMREASGGKSDSVFTSRSHIYQSLFDSVESYARVQNFVYNVMADILPRVNKNTRWVVGEIGEGGFRAGEEAWFESRLIRYFAPSAEKMVRK